MTVTSSDTGQPLLVVADLIHTMADAPADAKPVRALLVRAGRIAAAGEAAALRAAAPHAQMLDLTGTTVTPGLTDAHVHLVEWALSRREVDVGAATSPVAAAELVARHVAGRAGRTADDAGWVRGRGWNEHAWHGVAPDRSSLDALLPDRPVALQSHDMHALWVNTAALRAAGITADSPDPEGGRIVRDSAGEPTGLLLEMAGRLIMERVPTTPVESAVDAVRDAQRELHSLGITGVHSFPGIHRPVPTPGDVLRRLRSLGELRLRVLDHIPLEALDAAIAAGVRSGDGDEWLRTGALKMFLDGALGSRTAWLRAPYEDGGGTGMRMMEPALFRDVVRRAAAAGIASTVHAIGDAAVDLALDVLTQPELAVAAMPHRIEHLQCCAPERFGDAAAAGVVCSMQPSHLMTDWRAADACWGAARCAGAFALASLLEHGTVLAFGSDAPVEPVDPRRGLAAAVHRTDAAGSPAGGWFAAERIAPREALRGYTVGPALAAGLAAPAGTLMPGAVADLVAWDHDPVGEPDSLLDMRCIAALVDGVVVHSC